MRKNKTLREMLGENVTAIMLASKLSQPKVAALAKKRGTKVNQTTVSRVARGVYPATVDTVEAIANGLGVEPFRLFISESTDARLVTILRAWHVSSPQGKDLLLFAAEAAIKRDGLQSNQGGLSG